MTDLRWWIATIAQALALTVWAMAIALAARAACPTQPTSLVATGGKLSVCSDEATTAVEIERDGVVQPSLPIALVPGMPVDLAGYVQCSDGTLRARGINEAGAGPWGASVTARFPGCVAPVLGNHLP